MVRYVAGLVSVLLMIIGGVLFWQAKPDEAQAVPMPPPPQAAGRLSPLPEPPEATPKSREEKRFSRADKDKDGKIAREELLAPRRKAYAKLDTNGDGRLSFEEWAVRTIDKFSGADKDRSGWLMPAEYAATAPKPAKKKRCAC